jgi:ribonuclease HI
MKLKVYTDGACSGNPGKGGWAAIILDGNSNYSSISGAKKNKEKI